MIRTFFARFGHYVHDLCMFSCLAFFEGHWIVLTLAGLGVTGVVVWISIAIWKEVE